MCNNPTPLHGGMECVGDDTEYTNCSTDECKGMGMLTFHQQNKLECNTEKEGCMSYDDREDAQRPKAFYDIHPTFEAFN